MEDKIRQLLDKQDITETLLRYTRGIDRVDWDLVLSAFHEDATCQYGAFRGKPEDFVKMAKGPLATYEVTQHKMSNIQIELIGDKANVETYLLVLHALKSPRTEELSYVRLLDLFERRNSGWKISDRLVVIDYSTTRERTDPYSDEHHYSRFSRDKTDPLYRQRWK